MRKGRDFPAHSELAHYDTPESVEDTFIKFMKAEKSVFEQNVSTKSQKVAGVQPVLRHETDLVSFEVASLPCHTRENGKIVSSENWKLKDKCATSTRTF